MKEKEKEKRIKRNQDNLRDLWDNVKCPHILIIGVPEEADKKKDHETMRYLLGTVIWDVGYFLSSL